jgi:hypothetical protein
VFALSLVSAHFVCAGMPRARAFERWAFELDRMQWADGPDASSRGTGNVVPIKAQKQMIQSGPGASPLARRSLPPSFMQRTITWLEGSCRNSANGRETAPDVAAVEGLPGPGREKSPSRHCERR